MLMDKTILFFFNEEVCVLDVFGGFSLCVLFCVKKE